MNEVFKLVNEKSWRSVHVTNTSLRLLNDRYGSVEEFEKGYHAGGFSRVFRSKKEIAVAEINGLAHLETMPTRLTIRFGSKKEELAFDNSADCETVASFLAKERKLLATTQHMNKWKAASPSLIGIGVTALLTFLVYMDAQLIERGGYPNTSGRRGASKALFAWIAEKLGTQNTLIVGGLIAVVFLYFIVKKIQAPPAEVVYS